MVNDTITMPPKPPTDLSADFPALAVDYAYYNDSNIVIKFTTPLPTSDATHINIYHLYPPTSENADDGGTDLVNLAGGLTASFSTLSAAASILSFPISSLTNSSRFTNGNKTLLCLPYTYNGDLARNGSADPTAGKYQSAYYIAPVAYVPLANTNAPILNAALRNSEGDIMISMDAYTPLPPYMRLISTNGIAGTYPLSGGDSTVVLTYDGKTYLSLTKPKDATTGLPIAVGAPIILAGYNGVDTESALSESITVVSDTIYATLGAGNNDGTNVTLPLTSPLAEKTAVIIITSSMGGEITYNRYGSTNPNSIIFPTPTYYSIFLVTEKAGKIWSNYQKLVVPDVTATPPGSPDVPCFLASAPVLTPSGYQRISSLAAGDKVMTGDGRVVAIERIHRSRVAAAPSTNPYVIPKGQYGATRRLQISPNHRVQTANGMIEARHMGLAQEELTGTLDYYNLELPATSDTMIVAGVTVESMAHVRRITVPFAVFREMLTQRYGAVTPALLEKVKRTCRFLENGHVECPGIASK